MPHLPVAAEEVAATADCERIGAAVLDVRPRPDTVLAEVVPSVPGRAWRSGSRWMPARTAGLTKIAQRPPLPPARAAEILGLGK